MKLTKAQQKIYDEAKRVIGVCKRYETYDEFFENSPIGEQHSFDVKNPNLRNHGDLETFKREEPKFYDHVKKAWEACKNENIIIVRAKTETIEALEKAGLVKIIKRQEWEGGYDTIQVL